MPAIKHKKLSAEDRHDAIIRAVRRVFAEKGFYGTTTKELAKAAGVSEALLFKHFPTKEALYTAMHHAWFKRMDPEKKKQLDAIVPSTASLVFMVHDFVSHMLLDLEGGEAEPAIQNRLMFHSLLEDGEFARLIFKMMPNKGKHKIEQCIEAAIESGDAYAGRVRADLSGILLFQLASIVKIHLLQKDPVIDYRMRREELVRQVAWFVLRGMGIKEEAILRYSVPEAIERAMK